jgi:serine/threonine protein phosphatase PrpC
MAAALEFGASSDKGCVRENNEDSYSVDSPLNLFVLSDGMGGLAAGEVASRLAVDTIVAHCREAEANPNLPFVGEKIPGVSEASNRLASAARLASSAVYEAAEKNGAQQMGATLDAVRVTGERMSVVHVGDSRVYRLRGKLLEQLTQDHSFVAEQLRLGRMTAEEAESSHMRNVIVRALGIDPEVEVDVSEELMMPGDTILLCSDGLTRELSDAQIAATLAEAGSAKAAAGRLVDLAKQAGGGDNITTIVVRRRGNAGGLFARIYEWFRSLGF